jgi:hypothetical protein
MGGKLQRRWGTNFALSLFANRNISPDNAMGAMGALKNWHTHSGGHPTIIEYLK